jgi:hypothetical protein
MAPTLTSELDAVNTMLSTIGESPINSLDDISGVVDAVIARSVLNEVLVQVLEESWHFNTDTNYTLSPDNDGFIYLAPNVIQVDTTGQDELFDVAMRGSRLYDKENHTYQFTKSIQTNLTYILPFEELPQAARHYITIRAARVFQTRVVGAVTLHAFTETDELRARASLRKFEGNTADYNILTGNYSVMRVLDR